MRAILEYALVNRSINCIRINLQDIGAFVVTITISVGVFGHEYPVSCIARFSVRVIRQVNKVFVSASGLSVDENLFGIQRNPRFFKLSIAVESIVTSSIVGIAIRVTVVGLASALSEPERLGFVIAPLQAVRAVVITGVSGQRQVVGGFLMVGARGSAVIINVVIARRARRRPDYDCLIIVVVIVTIRPAHISFDLVPAVGGVTDNWMACFRLGLFLHVMCAAGPTGLLGIALNNDGHVVDLIDQIVGVLLCGVEVDHLVCSTGDRVGRHFISIIHTMAVLALAAPGNDGPLCVGALVRIRQSLPQTGIWVELACLDLERYAGPAFRVRLKHPIRGHGARGLGVCVDILLA